MNSHFKNNDQKIPCPKVFISYSHDSDDHEDAILALSDELRIKNGIECNIDQYVENPPEGWPQWMESQIKNSHFVIVVYTEKYKQKSERQEQEGKGLGAIYENSLITQSFYESSSLNKKFIPVIFSTSDKGYIPLFLKGTNYYTLNADDFSLNDNGFEALFRRITNQPKTPKPELGEMPVLLPKKRIHRNPRSLFEKTKGLERVGGRIVPNNQKIMKRKDISVSRYAGLIREASTEHQRLFTEYLYLGTNKLNNLSEYFYSQEDKQTDIVEDLFFRLCVHLGDHLNTALVSTDKLLSAYFRETSVQPNDKQPRICIKGIIKDNKLYDMYRGGSYNMGEIYPITANSGFEQVLMNGRYYLCNDIPEYALAGSYENRRLNRKLFPSYSIPKSSLSSVNDPNWVKLWSDYKGNVSQDPYSCYKSTLIFPISLNNLSMSPSFRKHSKTIELGDKELIYGFLCFDHCESEYFNEDIDIEFGHTFANILSLYFLKRNLCTKESNCYIEICKYLENKGRLEKSEIVKKYKGYMMLLLLNCNEENEDES